MLEGQRRRGAAEGTEDVRALQEELASAMQILQAQDAELARLRRVLPSVSPKLSVGQASHVGRGGRGAVAMGLSADSEALHSDLLDAEAGAVLGKTSLKLRQASVCSNCGNGDRCLWPMREDHDACIIPEDAPVDGTEAPITKAAQLETLSRNLAAAVREREERVRALEARTASQAMHIAELEAQDLWADLAEKDKRLAELERTAATQAMRIIDLETQAFRASERPGGMPHKIGNKAFPEVVQAPAAAAVPTASTVCASVSKDYADLRHQLLESNQSSLPLLGGSIASTCGVSLASTVAAPPISLPVASRSPVHTTADCVVQPGWEVPLEPDNGSAASVPTGSTFAIAVPGTMRILDESRVVDSSETLVSPSLSSRVARVADTQPMSLQAGPGSFQSPPGAALLSSSKSHALLGSVKSQVLAQRWITPTSAGSSCPPPLIVCSPGTGAAPSSPKASVKAPPRAYVVVNSRSPHKASPGKGAEGTAQGRRCQVLLPGRSVAQQGPFTHAAAPAQARLGAAQQTKEICRSASPQRRLSVACPAGNAHRGSSVASLTSESSVASSKVATTRLTPRKTVC